MRAKTADANTRISPLLTLHKNLAALSPIQMLDPPNGIGDVIVRLMVRYFASLREAAGVKEEVIELPDGCTIETLIKEARERHIMLKAQDRPILSSVNGEFVETSRRLNSTDEVALFPPVSGG